MRICFRELGTNWFQDRIVKIAVLATLALCWMPLAHAAQPSCGLNNGKSATGTPIPIGSINGVTGPDDFSSSARAADAYFKCVNANGGMKDAQSTISLGMTNGARTSRHRSPPSW